MMIFTPSSIAELRLPDCVTNFPVNFLYGTRGIYFHDVPVGVTFNDIQSFPKLIIEFIKTALQSFRSIIPSFSGIVSRDQSFETYLGGNVQIYEGYGKISSCLF